MITYRKERKDFTDREIIEWFRRSKWSNLVIRPDLSINLRMFVEQNILNPNDWQIALRFMNESNFNSMNEGRYDLGGGVYSTITDYFTKESSTVNYEAHRRFIDIQYVSRGMEYIGLTSLNDIISIIQPYDDEKDIEFFQKLDDNLLLADPTRYFVFFPSDGHKPCLKVDGFDKVRKVVIKIPYLNR